MSYLLFLILIFMFLKVGSIGKEEGWEYDRTMVEFITKYYNVTYAK